MIRRQGRRKIGKGREGDGGRRYVSDKRLRVSSGSSGREAAYSATSPSFKNSGGRSGSGKNLLEGRGGGGGAAAAAEEEEEEEEEEEKEEEEREKIRW